MFDTAGRFHEAQCATYATGCAVQNYLDSDEPYSWQVSDSLIAEWLVDGTVDCRCQWPAPGVWHAGSRLTYALGRAYRLGLSQGEEN